METYRLQRGNRTFKVTAPDEATANAELDAQLGEQQPDAGLGFAETAMDVVKSGGAGLARGAGYVAGTLGDAGDLMRSGGEWAGSKLGLEPLTPEQRASLEPPINLTPTSDDVIGGIEKIVGPLHEPQTTAGEYAHTVGEFAPAAAGGVAGLGRRFIGRAAIPAVGSETAGQLTEGTPYEAPSRLVGALIGAGAGHKVASSMRPPVENMSRRASGLMRQAVDPAAPSRLQKLGPEAMVLDASPSGIGTAQGVIAKPGRGRDRLVNALEARNKAKETRILSDADRALGPVQTPSYVDQSLKSQQASLGPAYTAVKKQAAPVDLTALTTQLNNTIPTLRGAPRKALEGVKRMIDGDVIGAQEAHNIRRALDDAINSGNLGNFELSLLGDARKAVDTQLAKAAPGIKSLDETFEQLAREREALAKGPGVLDSGKTAQRPEELNDMLTAMSGPERIAYKTGARAEIDRVLRTTANDAVALRRIVKGEGDWNRDKLAAVFGQERAKRIMASTDRETAFEKAYNDIVNNSQTAQRQQASKMIDAADEKAVNQTPALWERAGQIPEAAAKYAMRAAKRGIEGTRSDALRNELAGHLTAKGASRDTIVRKILENAAANPPEKAKLVKALIGLRASQGQIGVSP